MISEDAINDVRKKLESFQISDSKDQFGFVDRLARENRWDQKFAERVYREYLRFIFLAVSCDHHVTPSDQVDQAWHLHLLYTKSYWDDLCGQTLKQPIHHGPTRGGSHENKKFKDWYSRTLKSYEETFQEPPPGDIWPSTQARFAKAQSYSRVSSHEYFVIRRAPILRSLITVVTISLISCRHPFAGVSGSDFLMAYVIASLFTVGAALCGQFIKHQHSIVAKFLALPLFCVVIAGGIRIYQGIVTKNKSGFVIGITFLNCLLFLHCMDWLKPFTSDSSGSDCSSGCGGCGGCGD